MSALLTLVKGFTGKPTHAPLTDVSVGAYTVGVVMLIVGFLGFEEDAMAKGALLAISGGLIVAVPTALTGLLDWADISKGSAARKLANYHLVVMLTATVLFAVTWVLQRPGYIDGEVTLSSLIAGVAALGALTIGGTLGGALAYVYGVRVVKQDVSLADALIPGRLDQPSSGDSGHSGDRQRDQAPAQSRPKRRRDAQTEPVRRDMPTATAAKQTVAAPAAPEAGSLAEYEAYVKSKGGS